MNADLSGTELGAGRPAKDRHLALTGLGRDVGSSDELLWFRLRQQLGSLLVGGTQDDVRRSGAAHRPQTAAEPRGVEECHLDGPLGLGADHQIAEPLALLTLRLVEV